MNKIITILLTLLLPTLAFSQITDRQLNSLISKLKNGQYSEAQIDAKIDSTIKSLNRQGITDSSTISILVDPIKKGMKSYKLSDEEIQIVTNGIIQNPELYNTLWKLFIDQAQTSEGNKWKFLEDLNVQFKTFQTADNPNASLGLTYDFNFDYSKFTEHDRNRRSTSFGISAKGNIAFKKELNPINFLDTKIFYNYAHFTGGVVTKKDTSIFTRLNKIEDQLVLEKDVQSKKSVELWEAFGKDLELTNQYYYSFSPKAALESNQDFSKKQFTPGISIDLGAKAWNTRSILSYLNIVDYPFAIIRYITGTDKKITPYGSTIPTVQFTLDYVLPVSDTIRESLTGNLDPYPRIKFETGFRTFITRIKKENVFFNANYRYYRELNAAENVKKANLSTNSYFVMALQSTSGLYVSYASGKLPFSVRNDEIYSMGFNYKFN